jgi:nucleotide-binding universal stress UspA family protein
MVGRADAAHEAALEQARQRLADAGATVQARLIPGSPAVVIGEQLRESDAHLLVMGAYGHSPIREFFVGSTTSKLVRTSQVSVLMFRTA